MNLSARQFYQQDLVASVKAILDETGLAPHLLELELTEPSLFFAHATGSAARFAEEIRAVASRAPA